MAIRRPGSSKMSIRDHLWNYPIYILKFFSSTSPLSFIVFYLFMAFLIFSSAAAGDLDDYVLKSPDNKLVEGTVGSITSLNPIFIAQTQADKDIQNLVYQRFINIDTNGDPVPSIAKSWTVSKDNTIYTFTLNNDLRWQDGEPVTADDVVFTFETAIDLAQKYSKDTVGQSLEGIDVQKLSDYKVRIKTKEVNATFFESIAIYIVPKHQLENESLRTFEDSLFEEFPVGSGPYKVLNRDDMEVDLQKNEFYPTPAKIEYINYILYSTPQDLEVAFRNGLLDTVGNVSLADMPYISEYAKKYDILQTTLPFRKKILFINTRDKLLAGASIRRGLNYITNKKELLELAKVDGVKSDSPFAEVSWAYDPSLEYLTYNQKTAEAEFEAAGYTKDEKTGYFETDNGKILSLTLSYLDNDQNSAIANALKQLWDDEGIILELSPQTYDEITKETLATRDFELLLYEIEITVDPDQYNLWHSLKTDYPNLNLSGYNYDRADLLLERARETIDRSSRKDDYSILQRLLLLDSPVVILYEPKYNYVVSDRVEGVDLKDVEFPSERFDNVVDWDLK